jgi:hypothetical protein
MPRVFTLVLLVALGAASPARAQDQWGFSAGLTPSWQTGNPSRFLFAADQMNMKGSEVRFGVIRGDVTGGDWGFSFVNKSINENSTLQVDTSTCGVDQCGTYYRVQSRTRLTGVELHQFLAYKTWRDRVQMGMVGAVGVGWLRGTVYKRTVSEQGVLESFTVPADELYPPSTSVVPLVKLEIAATGIIGSGLKVRVCGGFSMPGYHTFDITVFYLVPGN